MTAPIEIDQAYLRETLLHLLAIPSPCGFTDEIVHYVGRCLNELDVPYDLTRRGTIRATLQGREDSPDRAVVSHLDTIGAMVRRIKSDGRILVSPIGRWSSRFAEGVRVTLFSDTGVYRGTLLPDVRWGCRGDQGVDQPVSSWDTVFLRLDAPAFSEQEVRDLGIDVGNYIALEPQPEFLDNGFLVSRHLDNKAGTATVLAAIKWLRDHQVELPLSCHPLFTITEIVGTGSGGALFPDVSELVTVDFASLHSFSREAVMGVALALQDASGPFDYHLTHHLLGLCREQAIPVHTTLLDAHHNDSSSAIVAGHDVRTAVITCGGHAAHSMERVHLESLCNVARLLVTYLQSKPVFHRDRQVMTTLDAFPHQIDAGSMPHNDTQLPRPEKLFGENGTDRGNGADGGNP